MAEKTKPCNSNLEHISDDIYIVHYAKNSEG